MTLLINSIKQLLQNNRIFIETYFKRLRELVTPIVYLLAVGVIYLCITNIFNFGLPCLINHIFHIYCPGCGVTRMLRHIANLDFQAAFSSNCLAFCLLPIGLLYYAYNFGYYLAYGKNHYSKTVEGICIILIFLAIAFAIIRNLYPIDILVP